VKKVLKKNGIELTKIALHDGAVPLGTPVLGVGFPFGQDSVKVGVGHVAGSHHVWGNLALQHSAPINPGNSGGPLLNKDGTKAYGINYAKSVYKGAERMSYAIPAWRIKHIMAVYKRNNPGDLTRYVVEFPAVDDGPKGVVDINSQKALYKMTGCSKGVYLAAVKPTSAFATADPPILSGSFLTKVDGVALDAFGEGQRPGYNVQGAKFEDLMYMRKDVLASQTLEVCHKGKVTTHKVSLKYDPAKHADAVPFVREPFLSKQAYELFGDIGVMPLTVNFANIARLRHLWKAGQYAPQRWKMQNYLTSSPKLVVNYVRWGSPWFKTMKRGEIVRSVNKQNVSTVAQLHQAIIPPKMKKEIAKHRRELRGDRVFLEDDADTHKKFVPMMFEVKTDQGHTLAGYFFYTAKIMLKKAKINKKFKTPVTVFAWKKIHELWSLRKRVKAYREEKRRARQRAREPDEELDDYDLLLVQRGRTLDGPGATPAEEDAELEALVHEFAAEMNETPSSALDFSEADQLEQEEREQLEDLGEEEEEEAYTEPAGPLECQEVQHGGRASCEPLWQSEEERFWVNATEKEIEGIDWESDVREVLSTV